MASLTVDFVSQNHPVVITGGPEDLQYIDLGGASSGLSLFSGNTNSVDVGYSGLSDTQVYDGQIRATGSAVYWTIFTSLNATATDIETSFLMRLTNGTPTGHGLTTNTVYGSNTWWTIETNADTFRVYISRTSAPWSSSAPLPILNYTAPGGRGYLDNEGGPFQIGFEGVAASSIRMPPNCLHPDTKIVVSLDGKQKCIKDMVSGDTVVVMDGDERVEVEATIVKTQPAMNKVFKWKGSPYITSENHVLYVPKAIYSQPQKGLPRGFPHVDGFTPVMAKQSDLATMVHMTCSLYHLVLPEEKIDCPVVLEGGWLTEPLRHLLGSQKRDAHFEVVERGKPSNEINGPSP